MADSDIPDDLREFILATFDSVAELEALLLLYADPTIVWKSARLAANLYTTENEAAGLLRRLSEHKFAVSPYATNGFRYDCGSPELCRMVDRLVQLYRKRLVAISQLIHSNPRIERQRR
jgi:hypothetical protein